MENSPITAHGGRGTFRLVRMDTNATRIVHNPDSPAGIQDELDYYALLTEFARGLCDPDEKVENIIVLCHPDYLQPLELQ
jgi:hypothetical protein